MIKKRFYKENSNDYFRVFIRKFIKSDQYSILNHLVLNFEDGLQKMGCKKKIHGIYIILNGKAFVQDIFGSIIAQLNVGDVFGENLLFNSKV